MKVWYEDTSPNILEKQKAFHSVLPLRHEFGDIMSVLKDGRTLTVDEHEAYCSLNLRILCRRRVYVSLNVRAHSIGGYGFHEKRALDKAINVHVAYMPTLDFHGKEVERFFLMPNADPYLSWPLVGQYRALPHVYFELVYSDIRFALCALKKAWQQAQTAESTEHHKTPVRKLHLKIVPLGFHLHLRSKHGDSLLCFREFYLLALTFACESVLNSSWIHTVEYIDSTAYLCPCIQIPGVRVLLFSKRDVLDFEGVDEDAQPAVLTGVDSFSVPGNSGLSSAIAGNTNIGEQSEFEYEALSP